MVMSPQTILKLRISNISYTSKGICSLVEAITHCPCFTLALLVGNVEQQVVGFRGFIACLELREGGFHLRQWIVTKRQQAELDLWLYIERQ